MPWEEALKNTSYSRQKTLQRCPKKFEYQYVQDLAPKREKDAFLLGKAVHHFLEIYYRTQINQDQDTAYQKAQEAYDEYAQIHFPDDEKALEQYELGKEMLRHYHSWAKENDQFRVIETEIQYELKIADSLDRGIWDGLVEMNGKYWILEHKTYKQIKTNHTLHDAQISKYFLVAEKNNIPVEGVIYNILKKAVPQKPRLLKNGKLSKSLSKNMTYDSYLAAIHEHGHQPEGYQDVLEKLKEQPNPFFHREYVSRNKFYSKSALRDLQNIETLKYFILKNHIYPRNLTRDCSWDCPFYDLCLAEIEGAETDYLLEEKYQKVLDK